MSFDVKEFTKADINIFLKELAKEYAKLTHKKMKAELILAGGASILVNYGFRNMTTDIDAIIQAPTAMKDAINNVGNKFGLPKGWLNSDFTKTPSFSSKLSQYSEYYKTYSNVLEIRTISAEYLIAMKLRSGREFKNDMSDILGILGECQKKSKTITIKEIQRAVIELYGDWDSLPKTSKIFIDDVMQCVNFEELYFKMRNEESKAQNLLLDFQVKNPGAVKMSNASDILNQLKNRKKSK